ncbi:MAG: hypothetical protein ACREBQ_14480, partial [Nitrososphaerales archaeon]
MADTRFLLVHTFPFDEKEREDIRQLMLCSLRDHLLIPSVVLAEYFKTAGRKIGKQGVLTRIFNLKESGALVSDIDESIA